MINDEGKLLEFCWKCVELKMKLRMGKFQIGAFSEVGDSRVDSLFENRIHFQWNPTKKSEIHFPGQFEFYRCSDKKYNSDDFKASSRLESFQASVHLITRFFHSSFASFNMSTQFFK